MMVLTVSGTGPSWRAVLVRDRKVASADVQRLAGTVFKHSRLAGVSKAPVK